MVNHRKNILFLGSATVFLMLDAADFAFDISPKLGIHFHIISVVSVGALCVILAKWFEDYGTLAVCSIMPFLIGMVIMQTGASVKKLYPHVDGASFALAELVGLSFFLMGAFCSLVCVFNIVRSGRMDHTSRGGNEFQ